MLAALGGALGLLVARWTLDLIISLLPPDAVGSVSGVDSTGGSSCSPPPSRVGTGLLFGLFPALHSTRPDLVNALKGQAGPAVGRARGGLVPQRRSSRRRSALVDAAAGLRRPLRQEPVQREPRRTGRQGRPHRHVRRLAAAERLHGDRGRWSCSSGSRTNWARCRASTGVTASHGAAARRAATGAAACDVEGFPSGPDTDTNARFNKIGPGYFQTLGIPLMAGREFTRADAADAAPGRDRERAVHEEVQPRAERRRQARPAGRAADSPQMRDRRRRGGRQVQRGEGRAAAAVLHAVPPGRDARLPDLLREDVAARRSSCSRPSRRSWRASTRTCRSRTCARWSSRCARTSSSIG